MEGSDIHDTHPDRAQSPRSPPLLSGYCPIFNCSTEKLSREIEPKIGHGDVVQLSRCRLSTTAVVAGVVVNSKLKACHSLLPFASGADCPRRFELAASLTSK